MGLVLTHLGKVALQVQKWQEEQVLIPGHGESRGGLDSSRQGQQAVLTPEDQPHVCQLPPPAHSAICHAGVYVTRDSRTPWPDLQRGSDDHSGTQEAMCSAQGLQKQWREETERSSPTRRRPGAVANSQQEVGGAQHGEHFTLQQGRVLGRGQQIGCLCDMASFRNNEGRNK